MHCLSVLYHLNCHTWKHGFSDYLPISFHQYSNLVCAIFQARSKLRHHSAAVQVPIGLEEDFQGLVDLVHMKAYHFQGSSGFASMFNRIYVVAMQYLSFCI